MEKIPVWDLPDVPKGQLPHHLEQQRTRVFCNSDAPTHVSLSPPLYIYMYIFNFYFEEFMPLCLNDFIGGFMFNFGLYISELVVDREHTLLWCIFIYGSG